MRTLAGLPDGSAGNDVAGPGCCAHHPGITLGGVICGGGDDDSPVGRGADVAGPRVPASALIRTGARPGIVQHGRQAPLPRQGRRWSCPGSCSRADGHAAPGSSALSTPRCGRRPFPVASSTPGTPFNGLSAPGSPARALCASGIYGPVWTRGIMPLGGGTRAVAGGRVRSARGPDPGGPRRSWSWRLACGRCFSCAI